MAAILKSADGLTETYIHFTAKRNCRYPYIKDLLNYSIDSTLNEGSVEFDGYYYVHDEEPANEYERRYSEVLPTKLIMNVCVMDSEAKPVPGEVGAFRQELVSGGEYLIEVYKREYIKNTDIISTIEDEDGEEMRVCFFPTDHQRLHFRILKEIKSSQDIPDEMCN